MIDDHENIIPFFSELKELIALYLKGNPAVRKISGYRKNLTAAIPSLGYLDERPIEDYERLLVDAFARGGKDEEERCRAEYADKKKNSTIASTEFGVNLSKDAKARRKVAFKAMMDDVKKQRKDLVDNYWDIKR